MSDNSLDLQDLYNELVVRELLDKTLAGVVTWTHLGGTQFKATETSDSDTWDFYISQTQVGNVTYKYNLDVKKNAVAYVTIQDGPLPYTARDSATQTLYNNVSIRVLELGTKVKETLEVIAKAT